jgi:hypothetical protein
MVVLAAPPLGVLAGIDRKGASSFSSVTVELAPRDFGTV